jgi:hypothetical protein
MCKTKPEGAGWILPDGAWCPCAPYGHEGVERAHKVRDGYKAGWLHVARGEVCPPPSGRLTAAQQDTLASLAAEGTIQIPDWVADAL